MIENRPSILGTVVSGRGMGRKEMTRLSGSIEEATGVKPFPGSLNVVFRQPLLLRVERTTTVSACRRYFWWAEINGLRCLAYRFPGCPLHVVEFVSDMRIRDALSLKDNDPVTVVMDQSTVADISSIRWIAWASLWKFDGQLFYTSDRYCRQTRRIVRRLPWFGQALQPTP